MVSGVSVLSTSDPNDGYSLPNTDRTPEFCFSSGSRVLAGNLEGLEHRGGGDLSCTQFPRTAYRMVSCKSDYVAPTEQGFVPLFPKHVGHVRGYFRRGADDSDYQGFWVGWVREDAVSVLWSGVNQMRTG